MCLNIKESNKYIHIIQTMEEFGCALEQYFQEYTNELGRKARQMFLEKEAQIIAEHIFPEEYWLELLEKKQDWVIVGIHHAQHKMTVTVEQDGLRNQFVFEETCRK